MPLKVIADVVAEILRAEGRDQVSPLDKPLMVHVAAQCDRELKTHLLRSPNRDKLIVKSLNISKRGRELFSKQKVSTFGVKSHWVFTLRSQYAETTDHS